MKLTFCSAVVALAACTTATPALPDVVIDTDAAVDGTMMMGDSMTPTDSTVTPDRGMGDAANDTGRDARDGGANPDGRDDMDTGVMDTAVRDTGPPRCGDGVINLTDQCDDGNITAGDGCSDTCQWEGSTCPTALSFNALAVADGTAQVVTAVTSAMRPVVSTASCRYDTFDDPGVIVWDYTVGTTGRLRIDTEASETEHDTLLWVQRTCGDTATEVACSDDVASGDLLSRLELSVTAGEHLFIFAGVYRDTTALEFKVRARMIPVRADGEMCDLSGDLDSCMGGAHVCLATGGTGGGGGGPVDAGVDGGPSDAAADARDARDARPTTGICTDVSSLGCGVGATVTNLNMHLTGAVASFTGTIGNADVVDTACGFAEEGESYLTLTLPFAARVTWAAENEELFDSFPMEAREFCLASTSAIDCTYGSLRGNGMIYPAGTVFTFIVEGDVGAEYTATVHLTRVADLHQPCDLTSTPAVLCATPLICRPSSSGTGNTCEAVMCGDGFVEGMENCEDTTTAADGCSSTCTFDDSCTNPIDLNANSVMSGMSLATVGSTLGAMSHANPDCSSSADGHSDRVFRYMPPGTGFISVNTMGPETRLDTVLYVQSTCGAETSLACNDDIPSVSSASRVTNVPVTAGTPVFIIVDSYGSTGGRFRLTVDWSAMAIDAGVGDGGSVSDAGAPG